MGFLKDIKEGWREGRNQHSFKLNAKKISFNQYQLANNYISYGQFISNTSYLFSEQIKYTINGELTDYQLNRLAINIGFGLILSCYCSIYRRKDITELEEDFNSFYWRIRDEYIKDFTKNNLTINNSNHLDERLNKLFFEYVDYPRHINEGSSFSFVNAVDVMSIVISRIIKDAMYSDFGIDLTKGSDPDYFDYLLENLLTVTSKNIAYRLSD